MKQATQNTFNEGLISDLNPLTTPNNVLTDALNATLITYNGNEFVLQNDQGNCKVERAKLPVGFIPIGMQEYGGIVYVASVNPETNEGEIGSFPSPERDFSTSDFTNISPVKFQTSQFVVDTGSGQQEKSSVLGKLVDPELLQLSPGDMYVVTFDINDPGVVTPPQDEIDDVTTMNNYISKDVLNRKLFRLKFYKITDSNTLTDLDPDEIKVIEDQPDLEGEYVYFKEGSKGVIAVGLELETLDSFDINVVDISKRTDQTKSAVIEALGYSNSLADFEGVKVDVTDPTPETFYINKTATTKKISAVITDLVANSKLSGRITPYSDYALYPKLSKDFNLELGKYAFAGSDTNNIFRYYVDSNYLKVDFDFKFEGNSNNGLNMYVEFYDPWSDYSVVKVVDNPTYYGVNSVQLELIDEPRVDLFNSITTGGTLNTNLITNTDTIYQKTLLNSTNLVRTSTTLRKNHFYIVRISGVDIDYSGSTPTYTHYDLYKGLFTNDLLNAKYIQQNSIQPNDPNYVADFNTIDFKIEDMVKYTTTMKEGSPLYMKGNLINMEDGVVGNNNKYYSIQENQVVGGSFKAGYNYTKSVTTDITTALSGEQYIFGSLKTGIVNLAFPNLDPGVGSVDPLLVPTIEDVGYINTYPQINPGSTAEWRLQTVTPNDYKLKKTVSTNRWVFGNKIRYIAPDAQELKRFVRDNISVNSKFVGLNDEGFVFDAKQIRLNGSLMANTCKTNKFDPNVAKSIINSYYGGSNKPAVIFARCQAIPTSDVSNSCQYNTYGGGRYFIIRFDDGFQWDGQVLALLRDPNGYYPSKITDANRAIIAKAYPEFRVHSAVERIVYVYYPDFDNIRYSDTLTTNGKFDNLYFNTNYTRVGAVKTYLSQFRFRALNTIADFSTANINAYITSRKSTSIIVDNKDNINDGFIPYINVDTSVKTNMTTSEIAITESSAANLITAFADAHNIWSSDPLFNNDNTYSHGQLYSLNPAYNDIVKVFYVGGVVENVAITESNFELFSNFNAFGYTPGGWVGVRNGSVKGDEKNYTARHNSTINI